MKFEVTTKLTKQIDEMRYLTADNAWRYRSILRYFYSQSVKMKNWLYQEEVFAALRENAEFESYTLELCRQDLSTLLSWGNLSAYQDTAKVATVEAFKNKQFRYQLTPYSVEIERLTIRLENLSVESASLEPTLLERLREELKKLPQIARQGEKEAGGWWNGINGDFKRLNQNYQDYIRDLYSLKAEEMMKTKAFLVFKDRFIDYLRDFVKGLQNHANAIEHILTHFDPAEVDDVLNMAVAHELAIPRLEPEVDEKAIADNLFGCWNSLNAWFLGEDGHQSEAAKLMELTNDIIRKITRYAAQISESRSSAVNRKEEYKKLAELFDGCQDIKEAHQLASLTFGIFHMKHLRSDCLRETESISSEIFDEAPGFFLLRPRVRGYHEKAQRTAIVSQADKKKAMMKQIQLTRKIEKETMDSYLSNHCIDFARLPIIEQHVRTTLLRWLSKAMATAGHQAKTEEGRPYRVELPENRSERCVLRCTDGELEMPAYVIRFLDQETEKKHERT